MTTSLTASMAHSTQRLRLAQALAVCTAHRQALKEALEDLRNGQFMTGDLAHAGKEQRRLLDQFAYRYTRLQDDMGARLMPAVLAALGEPVASLSVIDRLDRLEQLEWLPSAEEWGDLRRIRNEFAHDYPETPEQQFERLKAASVAAHRAMEILDGFEHKIRHRFPEVQHPNP